MVVLRLDGSSLTLDDVFAIAVRGGEVSLDPDACRRMQASRDLVERWVREKRTMYGVTTGFGEFSTVSIDEDAIEQLQKNLIVSHSAGCGEPIPKPVTRAMMLLRANALAGGYSGIRVETVRFLLDMLNADIVPVIPSQGSVGSSGDLVPLSHLVLGMTGVGECWDAEGNGRRPIAEALRTAGLTPPTLAAKEGLALINGTQMMTAYLSLAAVRAASLARQCDIAGAMTMEALRGTDRSCSPRLHAVRPHPGQQRSARNVLRLLEGSAIREAHRHGHEIVQDAYSLRCIPQVHGAMRDAMDYVRGVLAVEINSVTDNPLVFADGEELIEGGNFHGEPVALAGDFLAVALAELAGISERRIERLVNGSLSGLPRFLTRNGGLNSGLMIAQYTAAALVSENKVLAHPASVDSIPTSANQEDHNSMGAIAARKAFHVLLNAEQVVAIEFVAAAQGLDFHAPLAMGRGTSAAHAAIREVIPSLGDDRVLAEDLRRAAELVRNGAILEAVERRIGPLE
ncbi:MAG: histidine ammonia-lyase [Bacteroidota bacterium]|nr:histidine ammonia-lyase [Bacteroidota bacterium]